MIHHDAEGRSFCVGYDIAGGDPDEEAWKHDALKWHENLREGLALEIDALGHEEAGDRLGPGPCAGRRL